MAAVVASHQRRRRQRKWKFCVKSQLEIFVVNTVCLGCSSLLGWQFHKLSSIWIQLWWWWRRCYCCWQSCSTELKVHASFLIHSGFSFKNSKIIAKSKHTTTTITERTLRDDIERRTRRRNKKLWNDDDKIPSPKTLSTHLKYNENNGESAEQENIKREKNRMRNGITFSRGRNTHCSLVNRARKCENTFGELDISRVRFFCCCYFSRLFFGITKMATLFCQVAKAFFDAAQVLGRWRFNHIDKTTNLVRCLCLSISLSIFILSLTFHSPLSLCTKKMKKSYRVHLLLCSLLLSLLLLYGDFYCYYFPFLLHSIRKYYICNMET